MSRKLQRKQDTSENRSWGQQKSSERRRRRRLWSERRNKLIWCFVQVLNSDQFLLFVSVKECFRLMMKLYLLLCDLFRVGGVGGSGGRGGGVSQPFTLRFTPRLMDSLWWVWKVGGKKKTLEKTKKLFNNLDLNVAAWGFVARFVTFFRERSFQNNSAGNQTKLWTFLLSSWM